MFNFFLNMLWRLRSFRVRNPGIVNIRRTFGTRCANTCPTRDKRWFCWELPPHGRGIHRRKGYSTGNRQIMDEESSWRKMFIPPGITSSGTRNQPEKWDFAGNYQLIDDESTRVSGFHRELPVLLRWFRPVRSKCAENPSNGNNSRIISSKSYILYCQSQLFF
jgi:hypothetical protein